MIATPPDIRNGSDRDIRKYFMPYQVDVILDETRLNLCEKSIRVGITFAYAMRAVRRRMRGMGNLLHTSVTAGIARAFIDDCRRFNRIYDVTFASEPEEFTIWNPDDNREESAWRIVYKIPHGEPVFIEAFGSNENSLRGKGGEVNVDEITSHKRPGEMQQAAGGRAMWGDPVNIWSSHKGVDSHFNQLILRERARGAASRWNIRTITLPDALDQGLLDKINAIKGAHMSREDFIADTIAAVGGEEAYEEECLCKPRAAGSDAIPWHLIDKAKVEYDMHRIHVEGATAFDVEAWGSELIDELRGCERVAVGYDVARTGHLSSVAAIGRRGGKWRVRGLVTMHKRSFGAQREVVEKLMRAVPGSLGCGDAGGLGMQVCEELTTAFGQARFVGVMFSTVKPDMGTKLVRVLEDGNLEISKAERDEDIGFDLHAIKSEPLPSGRVRFYETGNPVNKLSHCDIAWSIAMAVFVGEDESAVQGMW